MVCAFVHPPPGIVVSLFSEQGLDVTRVVASIAPSRSRGTDGAQGLMARQRAAESDAKATAARSDGRARVSGRVVGVPPSARGRAGLRAAPRAFVQRRK